MGDVWKTDGGRELRRGAGKIVDEGFLDDLRAFGISVNQ